MYLCNENEKHKDIMIAQSQQQKMQQKLTPQQILLIRLLQIPSTLLEKTIKEEIEKNPLLEDDIDTTEHVDGYTNDTVNDEYSNLEPYNDFNIEEYMDDDFDISYKNSGENNNNTDKDIYPYASEISLQDHITEQFNLKELSEKEYLIGLELIGNIDHSGYITRNIESISNDIAFTKNIEADEKEIENVLKIIQTLDPIGIGARNLQECLLIQLHNIDEESKYKKWAITIIEKYFDAFKNKQHNKLIQKLNISEKDLGLTLELIVTLNPKPGAALSSELDSPQYLIPDFFVYRDNNTLRFSQNTNLPNLKTSKYYMNILKDISKEEKLTEEQKQTVSFIKEKAETAKWFIDAIKQRQETLNITMREILKYQEKFFMTGDKDDLRPMRLKDIAELTELDISTLSRVVNQKYVETEFGTIKLRNLFSMSHINEEGKDVALESIKNMVLNLIDNEDKSTPLSDEELRKLLNEKGFNLARRTITKYRESLNIPVGRLRKKINTK